MIDTQYPVQIVTIIDQNNIQKKEVLSQKWDEPRRMSSLFLGCAAAEGMPEWVGFGLIAYPGERDITLLPDGKFITGVDFC